MSEHEPILSLVIPCHNEEGNLHALIDAIRLAVGALNISYEVIIVDDRSTDHSWTVLKKMAEADARIRIQRFRSNCGESAASWAGIQAARGQYIITLDADLQHDPSDLPKFMDVLKSYDCACGTRALTRRNGDAFDRFVSSKIANWVREKMLADNISDSGCTYRAFRRACVSNIKFFRGGHRFLPALLKMEGFSVTEVPIKSNPRFSGKRHYGVVNRFFDTLIDLWGMWWMKDRMVRYEIMEKIN